MAFLSTNSVVQKISDLFGQGIYSVEYDHTDTNGNYVIQVFQVVNSETVTFDWFTVNPGTGNYTSEFNGYSGSLIAPEQINLLVSFASNGTSSKLQTTVNFPIAFTEAPTVFPGNVVQSVPYCDTMCYPFITNVSAGACTIVLNLANPANKFGTGTLKMNFLVSDKK